MGTYAQFASTNASELIDQKNSEAFEIVFKNTQAANFLVEVTDHNKFVFITSNESHQQKTGITSWDIAGKTPEELLGKELGSSISANYAKCLNEAKTIIYEEELSLPGGKRFWETSLTPVFENGKIVNIIGSSLDITDRKNAEKSRQAAIAELAASEKKYRTLLNASPEAVLLVNKEGSITEISDIAPGVFGKSGKDQLLGKSLYSLVPDDKCLEMENILQRAYEDEIIKDHQFVFKRNSHSRFIGEISVKLVSNELQDFKIFIVIIRDITDRKLMEQKLLRTERMASLGEMASVFAHEINQPLSIISLIVDKVGLKNADNNLSPDYLGKKCHNILENIHKIDSIIGQIRMFAGEKDIDEFKNIDLNDTIHKLLGFIQTQYKKYHIHFKMNLQDSLPPVYSSKLKIEQILVNLLSNASFALNEKAKYKQTNEFKKEISIRTYSMNNRIYLEVEDNGTGISDDIKDQLFDPFFTTKGPESGTGLGLFIIDRTLKEMKGSIELESHINKYTRFRINFPVSGHKL